MTDYYGYAILTHMTPIELGEGKKRVTAKAS